jgi:hypothetical protein
MSNSKPISNPLSAQPHEREMPSLPSAAISSAARHNGTKATIFFLALENFSNRYSLLPFISESLLGFKKHLTELSSKNSSLYHEVRQFILAMPLDTISTSAHPKKLKQVILETLLNPDILTLELVQTEKIDKKPSTATDTIRDLQYYHKLTELCTNPLYGREILTAIVQRTYLIKTEEKENLRLFVEQLPFSHPTDRIFILKQLQGESVIPLRTDQIISTAVHVRLPDAPKDYALLSICLFRRFMNLSQQIVARAGETLESIQNRASAQRKEYEQLVSDCNILPADDREKMHQLIGIQWKKFVTAKSAESEKIANFLNLLANPRSY